MVLVKTINPHYSCYNRCADRLETLPIEIYGFVSSFLNVKDIVSFSVAYLRGRGNTKMVVSLIARSLLRTHAQCALAHIPKYVQIFLNASDDEKHPLIFLSPIAVATSIYALDPTQSVSQALRECASAGLEQTCRFLLSLSTLSSSNDSAVVDLSLRLASSNGHTSTVELLLRNGADLHSFNEYALRSAAMKGRVEVVDLLLKAGARLSADNHGALRWACTFGHVEVVERLLQEQDCRVDDDTIMLSCRYQHFEVTQLLMHYSGRNPRARRGSA